MTVGFRADAETINGTAGTSVVVSRPSGTVDGDVLVAFITGASNMSVSTPAGWTLIGTETAGTAVRVAAFWKVASSEPASWTWTLGSSVRNGGWVGAFTGVDTSAPIHSSASTPDTTAGTSWAGALASVRAQSAIVAFAGLARTATGTGTTHTTTGTERADQTTNGGSGTDLSYAAATGVFSASGSSFLTVTSSQSCANGAMWSVVLAPAFIGYDGGDTGVIVEAAFGADPDDPDPATNWVWTDISQYVRGADGVAIGKGRADEQAQIAPTSIAFSVNNDGRFTPENVLGAYYPGIRRGLPVRVLVPYGFGVPTELATAFVESFTLGWDASLNHATVDVSAVGRLSRIRTGDTIRSPLYRTISGASGLDATAQAYWPMEDGSAATTFAAERGGLPIAVQANVTPAADDTVPGSAALPTVAATGNIDANVSAYTNTGLWAGVAIMRIDAPVASETILMEVLTTGATSRFRLSLVPGAPDTLRVRILDNTGVEVVSDTVSVTELLVYGHWMLIEMAAVQAGANINYSGRYFAWTGTTFAGEGVSGTVNTRTVGRVVRVGLGGPASPDSIVCSVGHLALFTDLAYTPGITSNPIAFAIAGQNQERADFRFGRLLEEEGVYQTLYIAPDPTLVTPMGPQPIATLDTMLREVEDADQGVVHDGGTLGGLIFIDRASRYNKTVDLALDMESGHIAPGWSPSYDTQRLRNRSTVSRTSGSSATYTGDTSDGIFPESLTLNLPDDQRLLDVAGWRVNVGTAPGMRYPKVGMDFRRNPDLVEDWLALQVGLSRVTATGLPTQHGPVDLDGFLEGYTQRIKGFEWTADLNLSPASPYTVGVWEDPVAATSSRWDGDASTTSGSITTGTSTSVSVVTPAGYYLWTTAAGDMPFDIDLAGARVRVTNVTGASSPQTFTISATVVNGVAKVVAAGAPVRLWQPGRYAL